MMRYLLVLVCSFLVFSASSQRPGGKGGERPAIGELSGTVIDELSNAPVEYATIAIYSKRDSSLVTGGTTNAKGKFYLNGIKLGKLRVVINFIGYEAYETEVILSPRESVKLDLGVVKLAPNVEALGIAEVVDERPYMQVAVDRKIYNIEKDPSTKGASASEALENIPSIELDADGNMSLRGSENVTVLIDGKPSALTGASRQALLESIPSSSIDQIEVITNPSAKFDPESMSGIINIVMKKQKLVGFHGNVAFSRSTDDGYNPSIGLNYRTKHVNIFSNYSYRYNNRWVRGTDDRTTFFEDVSTRLDQENDGFRGGGSHVVKLGSDFYLNPKTTLTASGTLSDRNRLQNETVRYDVYTDDLLDFKYDRVSSGEDNQKSYDITTSLRRNFSSSKHYLNVDAQYSLFGGEGTRDFNQTVPEEAEDIFSSIENTRTDNTNKSINLQADYEQPLANEGKLELGWRTTLRDFRTDFARGFFDTEEQAFERDTLTSNDFEYEEDVHAVYATYGRKIKESWSMQAGLRAEQVYTGARLVRTDSTFTNDYFSLYPSGNLAYQIDEKTAVSASYSRRVNRPRQRAINPFPNYTDPLNLRVGNPFLLPEYINSYELEISTRKGKSTYSAAAFYKGITDMIQRFKSVDEEGIATTTFRNLGSGKNFGFELIANTSLHKKVRVFASANFFRNVIDGNNVEAELNNSGFGISGRLRSIYSPTEKVQVQLTGFYRSPRQILQGRIKTIAGLDVSVSKTILNDKGSVSINLRDVFNTRRFQWETEGTNFEQSGSRQRQSRILTFTFSYRFGKYDLSKKGRGSGGGNGGGDDFDF